IGRSSFASVASIFLIEDDQAIRQTLVRSLSEQGHSVRAVGTAADALRDIAGWDPEVVVLDLGLPDIDGRDVIRMLRAVSQVPVIVATARDDPEEIVRLLDAGADDYVVKPYSAAEMGARIRAMLRRRRPATDRPRPPGGRGGRPRPGPHPPGVRPARPPGGPGGRGRHPPPVAGRGVEAALRRWRQDDGRPRGVAAPQARGERHRAPLSADGTGRGRQARRSRRMRRRLVAVALATTSLVAVA